MGTEVLRGLFGEDVHADLTFKDIKELRKEGNKDFVISDLRFDNEAEIIRKHGGTIWRVCSDRESDVSSENAEHASESGIKNSLVTDVIDNYGTLEDLKSLTFKKLEGLKRVENAENNRPKKRKLRRKWVSGFVVTKVITLGSSLRVGSSILPKAAMKNYTI